MRQRLRNVLLRLLRRTAEPPPDQSSTIRTLAGALSELSARSNPARERYMERVAELIEARAMVGSGPWTVGPAAIETTDRLLLQAADRFGSDRPRDSMPVRESNAITSQGIYGDLELALQNVEWRREVNLSWLEFSRWGIQQLILVCRLHYIKNPWIRRGLNLSAAYVFGQGVEISSPDPDANEVLRRWRERNKVALGQIALVEQEKRKGYDGNLFWCMFADTQNAGEVSVRLIDATEIPEIIYDPDDSERPWYYRRRWTQRTFDPATGQYNNDVKSVLYPALGYEPDVKPPAIGGVEVSWKTPVYHRKVGHIGGWNFGCPRIYPAIDWAKEGRKHLEACAAVTQALAQIALTFTTKGGQQAIEGAKVQFGTTVGPSSSLYDQNPPAGAGSTFASGPGSKLEVFRTRGAGTDPGEVKEYRNMAACALEIPPTWLGDMETSNLSTAQTLDRPTELGFMLKQEEWQEDLVVMATYALKVSLGAPSGRLREGKTGKGTVRIQEARRRMLPNGHWVYEAAKKPVATTVEVLCTFPDIREGDIPALIKATYDAMVIDRQGAGHGIDEKVAAKKFYQLLGIDNADELVEEMYPEDSYEPDRTKEPDPPVVPPIVPVAAVPGAKAKQPAAKEAERIRLAMGRVDRALRLHEAEPPSNGR